jgi:hypothetical protein
MRRFAGQAPALVVITSSPEPWLEREAERLGATIIEIPFDLAFLRRTVLIAIAQSRRCRMPA